MKSIHVIILSFYLVQFAACGTFQVKVESITKEGRFYNWTIQVECISDEFNTYYVHRPDQWGKTSFYSKYNGKPIKSTNTLLVSPLLYKGIIFKNGDKFKFKYKSEAKDGALIFPNLGDVLPIYKNKSKVKVSLRLWISDFRSGKCKIEYIESGWVDLNFPFKLSVPPKAKADNNEQILPKLDPLPERGQ
ncbi:MAG: hypothetical protein H7A51_04995 [Akkermansiaceae bacterium]|nr:hypothetical protein [Akkermansiaceae bacterium]